MDADPEQNDVFFFFGWISLLLWRVLFLGFGVVTPVVTGGRWQFLD